MERLSEALSQQMEEAKGLDPRREIPVIVTIKSGTDPAILTRLWLKIQHTFESISTVSGTLTAAEIAGLAQLSEIERIEFDGTVRAL